jgi:hypothetical protein
MERGKRIKAYVLKQEAVIQAFICQWQLFTRAVRPQILMCSVTAAQQQSLVSYLYHLLNRGSRLTHHHHAHFEGVRSTTLEKETTTMEIESGDSSPALSLLQIQFEGPVQDAGH